MQYFVLKNRLTYLNFLHNTSEYGVRKYIPKVCLFIKFKYLQLLLSFGFIFLFLCLRQCAEDFVHVQFFAFILRFL